MKKNIFQILLDSCKEITGQISSKRIIAYIGTILIIGIVACILYVMVHAANSNEDLKPQVIDLVHFVGAVVLVSVIGFVLTILGYALSQNKTAIGAGLGQCLPKEDVKVDPTAEQQ